MIETSVSDDAAVRCSGESLSVGSPSTTKEIAIKTYIKMKLGECKAILKVINRYGIGFYIQSLAPSGRRESMVEN